MPIPLRPKIAPQLAFVVTIVIFIGFASNALIRVVASAPSRVSLAIVVAALVAALVLQLGVISRPGADVRTWKGYLALTASAALFILPFLPFPSVWGGVQGFIAGNALLILPAPAGYAVTAIISTIAGLVQGHLYASPIMGVYAGLITVSTGLIVYGLSRLLTLIAQLQAVRTHLADAAVTDVRLRFVRNVQDLLDNRISALGLKAELASRLARTDDVRTDAECVKAELADIMTVSRQTLDEVRSVARGYRELPLDDEVNSALKVLSAADVDVTADVSLDDVSPQVRTAFAMIIREGATNVLRYKRASWCRISLRQDGPVIDLAITNDGRPATETPVLSEQLRDLGDRLAALGGELSARPGEDGTVVVQARVAAGPEPAGGTQEVVAPPQDEQPVVAQRLIRFVVIAVIAGYVLTTETFVLHPWLDTVTAPYPRIGSGAVLLATVCLTVTGLIQAGFSRPHGWPYSAPLLWLALLVQAVAVVLPAVLYRNPTIVEAGFLAACALLVFRRPLAGWSAFAVVAATIGLLQAIYTDNNPILIQYGLAAVVNHGLAVYAVAMLQSTVTRLREARTELADLAVAKERLRLARDLHDLLGYSLATMAVKAELAHRLIATRPERARHQIADVLTISRQALADVRSVSSGYRDMSLDEECASARSILDAAGIAAKIEIGHGELSGPVGTVLATVLREGLTNLLRHSKAEHCTIRTTQDSRRAAITVINDGVAANSADSLAVGGNGLHNLGERVAGLSGELTATVQDDDTFRMHTWVPLDAAPHPTSQAAGQWERLRTRLSH
jgi:signal transduction histidine kinase